MEREPTLTFYQKFFFSLGHFYNDLCSAMWFTYLLIFFTDIIKMLNTTAGYLLLLGQIIDAVSTPLIGYESDVTSGICGYGKRKSWHALGSIMVTVSFVFLFLPCLASSDASDLGKAVYYAGFVVIFQIGWASVQIAHMTLVTELTSNESERVGLNSYRNAMTLFANVTVYSVAWGLFYKDSKTQWTQDDSFLFMMLMIFVVILGLFATIPFHIFTKEKTNYFGDGSQLQINPSIQRDHEDSIEHLRLLSLSACDFQPMKWTDWLKEGQFYVVLLCYMSSRLISNISQTYWPFYVMDSLQLSKKYAAIVPLVVFISGFFSSLIMKPLNSMFGRKPSFLLGSILTGCALLWMAFLRQSSAKEVFGSAILLGIGSTTLLVTSLSMIADVIGNHTNTSAFVYGVMSFGDKMSSGLALITIQSLEPHCPQMLGYLGHCVAVGTFFQTVMVYVLVAFDLFCFLLFFILIPFDLGFLKKYQQSNLTSIRENSSQHFTREC